MLRAVDLRRAALNGSDSYGFWMRLRVPVVAGEPLRPTALQTVAVDFANCIGVALDPARRRPSTPMSAPSSSVRRRGSGWRSSGERGSPTPPDGASPPPRSVTATACSPSRPPRNSSNPSPPSRDRPRLRRARGPLRSIAPWLSSRRTMTRPTGRTTPPCAPRCGGRCTWRSTPRPTSSRTWSACSWSPPTRPGGSARTWTRPSPAGSGPRSWPARFVEDLVTERAAAGVGQYVILGAGLDTFAERRAELGADLRVFEIDQPGTQAWKRRRLVELGFGVPDRLRLVPVDFESGESWWDGLRAAGFDPGGPAVVASTGVSMYLTKEATAATLRQLATLAAGSTVAMTFLLPAELLDEADRPGLEMSSRGAQRLGDAVHQLLHPRRAARRGPRSGVRRCSPRVGRELAASATSPGVPTACDRPPGRTWSSPRPDTASDRSIV